jgi:hypothetical protein
MAKPIANMGLLLIALSLIINLTTGFTKSLNGTNSTMNLGLAIECSIRPAFYVDHDTAMAMMKTFCKDLEQNFPSFQGLTIASDTESNWS